MSEKFRTLYVDPGEDTGWVIGRDTKLLAGGTTKMWEFADEVWKALQKPDEDVSVLNGDLHTRKAIDPAENYGKIGRIVAEDWRIYPNVARVGGLDWDQCRTARLIGALTAYCRITGIPLVLQPAAIKSTAEAGGAHELYWRPLKENRHQNDALQHYFFYTQTELLHFPTTALDNIPGQPSEVDE
jgi:hypothetical protein